MINTTWYFLGHEKTLCKWQGVFMKKIMSKSEVSLYLREDLAVKQGYEKDFQ